MADFFGGLLSGFGEALTQRREQNRIDAERRNQQELSILSHLATSDDPEIQARAVAGLLESVNPRRTSKGLRGFLGETEGNPALPAIRSILGTPLPSSQPPPLVPGGAAQPSTSLVTGGPPSRSEALDVEASQEPPTPQGLPPATVAPSAAPLVTPTIRTPFLSSEERMRRATLAKASANVEGEVQGLVASGFTPAEARDIVKQNKRRAYGGEGVAEGEIVADPASDTGYSQILYDRRTGAVVSRIPSGPPRAGGAGSPGGIKQYLLPDGRRVNGLYSAAKGGVINVVTGDLLPPEAQPVTTTAGATAGAAIQRAIQLLYPGRAYGDLNAQEAAAVNTKAQELEGQIAEARTTGAGRGQITTQYGKPISISEAATQGVPVGTTLGDIAAAGGVPVTAQQRQVLDALAPLREQVDTIRQALTVLPSNRDLIGGLAPGMVVAAKRRMPQYRVPFARLEAAVDLAVNNMARVLGGARGAQSEKDAERAYNALVNLKGSLFTGDTRESAAARLDEAMKAIDQVTTLHKGLGAQGVQPSGRGRPSTGPPARGTAQAAPADTFQPGEFYQGEDGQLYQVDTVDALGTVTGSHPVGRRP